MRRPRSRQDLIILYASRLDHEHGLGSRRFPRLHLHLRRAGIRAAGRAREAAAGGAAVGAVGLARGFSVDGNAVPAAEVEDELVDVDGAVGVVPEEGVRVRMRSAAGRGVDEGDVVAEADGDDFVFDGEDDGRVVGCGVLGGGWKGVCVEGEFLDADAVDDVGGVARW